jgi:DNA processing protein
VGHAGPLGGAGAPRRLAEREALAVLVSIDGLGPATLAKLIDRIGSARAILEVAVARRGLHVLTEAAQDARLGDVTAIRLARAIIAVAPERLRIFDGLQRTDLSIVTVEDGAYPARLRSIDLPPHVLFVRGDVASLSANRAVAVVGTRRPTTEGRNHAARIGAAVARAGAAVISGLAYGIDGAAHEAVVAEAGITVAVLGGGHDHLFPRGHSRLAGKIVEAGGAVVSELPPMVQPTRWTFPQRNRLISGLSDATVVVEAPTKSGALHTANWAMDQGRALFLVPGSIDSRPSAGCLSYLRAYHGEARIVAGVPQLLEDLGLTDLADPLGTGSLEPPVAAVLVELGDGARRVAAALVRGRTTADELVATTDLPIGAVLGILTILEARGLAVSAYGRYRPAGRLAAGPDP